MTSSFMYNLTIIGSGPAGLTAAIYAARANLAPLLIEGWRAGGQLTITTEVENYPGFAEGIMGPELMKEMRAQAERFGTVLKTGDVTSVDLLTRPFKIVVDGEETFETKTLIIATGTSPITLGLPNETRLWGHGVSSCATCDGFFFKGKELVVVGGGDGAMEEATFLTKFATKVSIIHRRDKLRASKIMQDRAMKNEKIAFVWNSVVEDVLGQDVVTGVRIRNVVTGKVRDLPCAGFFLAIGHRPNTALFSSQLKTDSGGYLVTNHGTATSVPGVFAAGDVQDAHYRQAVTAAGTGCMAAIDAERFLEAGKVEADSRPPAWPEALTEREHEIIRLVGQGFSNKDIAYKLSISDSTVRHHMTSIFDKVGVPNRQKLLVHARHHRPTPV